jgi:hypothetical protein
MNKKVFFKKNRTWLSVYFIKRVAITNRQTREHLAQNTKDKMKKKKQNKEQPPQQE